MEEAVELPDSTSFHIAQNVGVADTHQQQQHTFSPVTAIEQEKTRGEEEQLAVEDVDSTSSGHFNGDAAAVTTATATVVGLPISSTVADPISKKLPLPPPTEAITTAATTNVTIPTSGSDGEGLNRSPRGSPRKDEDEDEEKQAETTIVTPFHHHHHQTNGSPKTTTTTSTTREKEPKGIDVKEKGRVSAHGNVKEDAEDDAVIPIFLPAPPPARQSKQNDESQVTTAKATAASLLSPSAFAVVAPPIFCTDYNSNLTDIDGGKSPDKGGRKNRHHHHHHHDIHNKQPMLITPQCDVAIVDASVFQPLGSSNNHHTSIDGGGEKEKGPFYLCSSGLTGLGVLKPGVPITMATNSKTDMTGGEPKGQNDHQQQQQQKMEKGNGKAIPIPLTPFHGLPLRFTPLTRTMGGVDPMPGASTTPTRSPTQKSSSPFPSQKGGGGEGSSIHYLIDPFLKAESSLVEALLGDYCRGSAALLIAMDIAASNSNAPMTPTSPQSPNFKNNESVVVDGAQPPQGINNNAPPPLVDITGAGGGARQQQQQQQSFSILKKNSSFDPTTTNNANAATTRDNKNTSARSEGAGGAGEGATPLALRYQHHLGNSSSLARLVVNNNANPTATTKDASAAAAAAAGPRAAEQGEGGGRTSQVPPPTTTTTVTATTTSAGIATSGVKAAPGGGFYVSMEEIESAFDVTPSTSPVPNVIATVIATGSGKSAEATAEPIHSTVATQQHMVAITTTSAPNDKDNKNDNNASPIPSSHHHQQQQVSSSSYNNNNNSSVLTATSGARKGRAVAVGGVEVEEVVAVSGVGAEVIGVGVGVGGRGSSGSLRMTPNVVSIENTAHDLLANTTPSSPSKKGQNATPLLPSSTNTLTGGGGGSNAMVSIAATPSTHQTVVQRSSMSLGRSSRVFIVDNHDFKNRDMMTAAQKREMDKEIDRKRRQLKALEWERRRAEDIELKRRWEEVRRVMAIKIRIHKYLPRLFRIFEEESVAFFYCDPIIAKQRRRGGPKGGVTIIEEIAARTKRCVADEADTVDCGSSFSSPSPPPTLKNDTSNANGEAAKRFGPGNMKRFLKRIEEEVSAKLVKHGLVEDDTVLLRLLLGDGFLLRRDGVDVREAVANLEKLSKEKKRKTAASAAATTAQEVSATETTLDAEKAFFEDNDEDEDDESDSEDEDAAQEDDNSKLKKRTLPKYPKSAKSFGIYDASLYYVPPHVIDWYASVAITREVLFGNRTRDNVWNDLVSLGASAASAPAQLNGSEKSKSRSQPLQPLQPSSSASADEGTPKTKSMAELFKSSFFPFALSPAYNGERKAATAARLLQEQQQQNNNNTIDNGKKKLGASSSSASLPLFASTDGFVPSSPKTVTVTATTTALRARMVQVPPKLMTATATGSSAMANNNNTNNSVASSLFLTAFLAPTKDNTKLIKTLFARSETLIEELFSFADSISTAAFRKKKNRQLLLGGRVDAQRTDATTIDGGDIDDEGEDDEIAKNNMNVFEFLVMVDRKAAEAKKNASPFSFFKRDSSSKEKQAVDAAAKFAAMEDVSYYSPSRPETVFFRVKSMCFPIDLDHLFTFDRHESNVCVVVGAISLSLNTYAAGLFEPSMISLNHKRRALLAERRELTRVRDFFWVQSQQQQKQQTQQSGGVDPLVLIRNASDALQSTTDTVCGVGNIASVLTSLKPFKTAPSPILKNSNKGKRSAPTSGADDVIASAADAMAVKTVLDEMAEVIAVTPSALFSEGTLRTGKTMNSTAAAASSSATTSAATMRTIIENRIRQLDRLSLFFDSHYRAFEQFSQMSSVWLLDTVTRFITQRYMAQIQLFASTVDVYGLLLKANSEGGELSMRSSDKGGYRLETASGCCCTSETRRGRGGSSTLLDDNSGAEIVFGRTCAVCGPTVENKETKKNITTALQWGIGGSGSSDARRSVLSSNIVFGGAEEDDNSSNDHPFPSSEGTPSHLLICSKETGNGIVPEATNRNTNSKNDASTALAVAAERNNHRHGGGGGGRAVIETAVRAKQAEMEAMVSHMATRLVSFYCELLSHSDLYPINNGGERFLSSSPSVSLSPMLLASEIAERLAIETVKAEKGRRRRLRRAEEEAAAAVARKGAASGRGRDDSIANVNDDEEALLTNSDDDIITTVKKRLLRKRRAKQREASIVLAGSTSRNGLSPTRSSSSSIVGSPSQKQNNNTNMNASLLMSGSGGSAFGGGGGGGSPLMLKGDMAFANREKKRMEERERSRRERMRERLPLLKVPAIFTRQRAVVIEDGFIMSSSSSSSDSSSDEDDRKHTKAAKTGNDAKNNVASISEKEAAKKKRLRRRLLRDPHNKDMQLCFYEQLVLSSFTETVADITRFCNPSPLSSSSSSSSRASSSSSSSSFDFFASRLCSGAQHVILLTEAAARSLKGGPSTVLLRVLCEHPMPSRQWLLSACGLLPSPQLSLSPPSPTAAGNTTADRQRVNDGKDDAQKKSLVRRLLEHSQVAAVGAAAAGGERLLAEREKVEATRPSSSSSSLVIAIDNSHHNSHAADDAQGRNVSQHNAVVEHKLILLRPKTHVVIDSWAAEPQHARGGDSDVNDQQTPARNPLVPITNDNNGDSVDDEDNADGCEVIDAPLDSTVSPIRRVPHSTSNGVEHECFDRNGTPMTVVSTVNLGESLLHQALSYITKDSTMKMQKKNTNDHRHHRNQGACEEKQKEEEKEGTVDDAMRLRLQIAEAVFEAENTMLCLVQKYLKEKMAAGEGKSRDDDDDARKNGPITDTADHSPSSLIIPSFTVLPKAYSKLKLSLPAVLSLTTTKNRAKTAPTVLPPPAVVAGGEGLLPAASQLCLPAAVRYQLSNAFDTFDDAILENITVQRRIGLQTAIAARERALIVALEEEQRVREEAAEAEDFAAFAEARAVGIRRLFVTAGLPIPTSLRVDPNSIGGGRRRNKKIADSALISAMTSTMPYSGDGGKDNATTTTTIGSSSAQAKDYGVFHPAPFRSGSSVVSRNSLFNSNSRNPVLRNPSIANLQAAASAAVAGRNPYSHPSVYNKKNAKNKKIGVNRRKQSADEDEDSTEEEDEIGDEERARLEKTAANNANTVENLLPSERIIRELLELHAVDVCGTADIATLRQLFVKSLVAGSGGGGGGVSAPHSHHHANSLTMGGDGDGTHHSFPSSSSPFVKQFLALLNAYGDRLGKQEKRQAFRRKRNARRANVQMELLLEEEEEDGRGGEGWGDAAEQSGENEVRNTTVKAVRFVIESPASPIKLKPSTTTMTAKGGGSPSNAKPIADEGFVFGTSEAASTRRRTHHNRSVSLFALQEKEETERAEKGEVGRREDASQQPQRAAAEAMMIMGGEEGSGEPKKQGNILPLPTTQSKALTINTGAAPRIEDGGGDAAVGTPEKDREEWSEAEEEEGAAPAPYSPLHPTAFDTSPNVRNTVEARAKKKALLVKRVSYSYASRHGSSSSSFLATTAAAAAGGGYGAQHSEASAEAGEYSTASAGNQDNDATFDTSVAKEKQFRKRRDDRHKHPGGSVTIETNCGCAQCVALGTVTKSSSSSAKKKKSGEERGGEEEGLQPQRSEGDVSDEGNASDESDYCDDADDSAAQSPMLAEDEAVIRAVEKAEADLITGYYERSAKRSAFSASNAKRKSTATFPESVVAVSGAVGSTAPPPPPADAVFPTDPSAPTTHMKVLGEAKRSRQAGMLAYLVREAKIALSRHCLYVLNTSSSSLSQKAINNAHGSDIADSTTTRNASRLRYFDALSSVLDCLIETEMRADTRRRREGATMMQLSSMKDATLLDARLAGGGSAVAIAASERASTQQLLLLAAVGAETAPPSMIDPITSNNATMASQPDAAKITQPDATAAAVVTADSGETAQVKATGGDGVAARPQHHSHYVEVVDLTSHNDGAQQQNGNRSSTSSSSSSSSSTQTTMPTTKTAPNPSVFVHSYLFAMRILNQTCFQSPTSSSSQKGSSPSSHRDDENEGKGNKCAAFYVHRCIQRAAAAVLGAPISLSQFSSLSPLLLMTVPFEFISSAAQLEMAFELTRQYRSQVRMHIAPPTEALNNNNTKSIFPPMLSSSSTAAAPANAGLRDYCYDDDVDDSVASQYAPFVPFINRPNLADELLGLVPVSQSSKDCSAVTPSPSVASAAVGAPKTAFELFSMRCQYNEAIATRRKALDKEAKKEKKKKEEGNAELRYYAELIIRNQQASKQKKKEKTENEPRRLLFLVEEPEALPKPYLKFIERHCFSDGGRHSTEAFDIADDDADEGCC